ncbi:branched-chain amino acid transaminase [Candidatus Saccharibacteria bacterium]|nr:branched-chain amino acid transaminase [Candidatus Saccharibacteria bacterium]
MIHNDYLEKAYFEGEIIDFKDANVPIATAGLQYAIATFAGLRGYRQSDGSMAILRLADHAQRMAESVKILGFPYKKTPEKLAQIISDTVKANSPSQDIYIRPFIYRSDIELGPKITGDYQLAVYAMHLKDYLEGSKGLQLATSSWIRVPDNAIPAKAKASGAYINAALAIEEAQSNGFDSAIMLDHKGDVGEGAVMNLFMVRHGKLLTPGLGGDLLEGITRRSVVELAKLHKIPMYEGTIRRSQLYTAEEAFVTGTAAKVSWVAGIDRREISQEPGAITKRISDSYEAIVRGEHTLSDSWLTKI